MKWDHIFSEIWSKYQEIKKSISKCSTKIIQLPKKCTCDLLNSCPSDVVLDLLRSVLLAEGFMWSRPWPNSDRICRDDDMFEFGTLAVMPSAKISSNDSTSSSAVIIFWPLFITEAALASMCKNCVTIIWSTLRWPWHAATEIGSLCIPMLGGGGIKPYWSLGLNGQIIGPITSCIIQQEGTFSRWSAQKWDQITIFRSQIKIKDHDLDQ